MHFKSQLLKIVIGFLFFSSFCYSQEVSDLNKKIDLIPYTTIYKVSEDFTATEIDSLMLVNKLDKTELKSSQGFSHDVFWVHFQVPNQFSKPLIELNNPHINNVLLYQKKNDVYREIGYGGDMNRKFHDRSYNNRRFIFPLEFNSNTEYLLMVDQRNGEVSFPLWLWEQPLFEKRESKANVYYGLFFGMLFFISFLSLITSVVVWKRVFLFYGLYTLFMGLYLFTYLGFSFQYLYPNYETMNNYTRFPSIVIFVVALILFLQSFLNIEKNLPRLSKYYTLVVGVFVFNLLGWVIFTDYYVANAKEWLNLLYGFIFTVLISAFYAAYKELKHNRKTALIFYVAFSFVFVGIILFVIAQYGIIQESIFPINPIIIGSGIEVLVLSVAMMLILKKMIATKEQLELKTQDLEAHKSTLSILNKELQKELEESTKLTIQLKSKAVLNVDDILYIQSDGHYVEYYMYEKEKPEIDRSTMKAVIELLPSTIFVRVHKSYIVNVQYIRIINSNQLMLDTGVWIKLSRTYKQGLKDILNKK